MYNTLKRLYQAGKLDESGLEAAVAKGWITVEQKAEIMAGK